MPVLGLTETEFHDLASQILLDGHRLCFQASGISMQPCIQNGDILEVIPLGNTQVNIGDILLIDSGNAKLLAHRVVKINKRNGTPAYLVKSDTSATPDGWFQLENILGRVEIVIRENKRIVLSSPDQRTRAWIRVIITPWTSKITRLPEWFHRHLQD